jgi:hypothetical protein
MASVQAGELLPRWNAFNFRYLQFANEWPESLISARSIALSHRTRWPRRRAPKEARVGVLCNPFCNVNLNHAFLPELRKLGWVEGTTIVIERKDPDYRLDLLPALAADLVRSKPNLIVAFTPQVRALRRGCGRC